MAGFWSQSRYDTSVDCYDLPFSKYKTLQFLHHTAACLSWCTISLLSSVDFFWVFLSVSAIKSDLEVQLHHSNLRCWHKPSSIHKQEFIRAGNVGCIKEVLWGIHIFNKFQDKKGDSNCNLKSHRCLHRGFVSRFGANKSQYQVLLTILKSFLGEIWNAWQLRYLLKAAY